MKAGLPFWVAILAVPLIIAAIGFIIEIVILRPTYKLGHLSQVLLTFGLVYIFHDLFTIVWGKDVLSVNPPAAFSRSVEILGFDFRVSTCFDWDWWCYCSFLWYIQEKQNGVRLFGLAFR